MIGILKKLLNSNNTNKLTPEEQVAFLEKRSADLRRTIVQKEYSADGENVPELSFAKSFLSRAEDNKRGKVYKYSFDEMHELFGDILPDTPFNRRDFTHFRGRYDGRGDVGHTDNEFAVMFTDWLLFCKDDGYDMDDYFDYEFFLKSRPEREKFVSANFRDNLRRKLNKKNSILVKKGRFLRTFRQFIKRSWIDCGKCTQEEFEQFVKTVPVFFAKAEGGSGGDGIIKVDAGCENTEDLYKRLKEKMYIAEEAITQHPVISEFNADTINTIRIVTLADADDQILITGAAMRFGRKGGFTDNYHQGGLCALVDPEQGVIISDAVDRSGARYDRHPDSQKEFKGFHIPEWEKLRNLAIEAADFCKDKERIVGWDLCVNSDSEVDIIEGNSRPGFDILQTPDMTGRRVLYEQLAMELVDIEELHNKEIGYWRKKIIS